MKYFKRVCWVLVAVVGGFVLWIGINLWQNDRTVPLPAREILAGSLERGITWLVSHDNAILGQDNPMLWWMVREAAGITGDLRLRDLFGSYQQRYLHRPGNMWIHLFEEDSRDPIHYMQVEGLPYYMQYFLYTLTCDELLGIDERIQHQNAPDFCDDYPYNLKAACMTHQLMGFRFAQRRHCGDQSRLAAAIGEVQGKIERQLTWDFRVVDVYIQRVLMLVDSGARERVKPVWVQRLVDAQLADGGWGDGWPVVRLGLDRPLCLTPHGLSFRKLKSNFHATAQGVWLMSLLSMDPAARM